MSPIWFKNRGYRHFDKPVCEAFARKVSLLEFVAKHTFLPLIHYDKEEIRYKYDETQKKRVTVVKKRPIKYASHRDACILSYYAYLLGCEMEKRYVNFGLSDSVIAYRALGKANYTFAAEAMAFAETNAPVVVLAFDVTGFFDNLDHKRLKRRLKDILKVPTLDDGWISVFRYVTRFHFVALDDLKSHAVLGARLKERFHSPFARVSELKQFGISFRPNPTPGKGIPQGTPISAALSNLYMLAFDVAAKSYCDEKRALYRRYSDDILIICKPGDEVAIEAEVTRLIAVEKLELNAGKTERTKFDASTTHAVKGKVAQYLGFNLHEGGAAIRQSSLSRQWRKMRRSFSRTRRVALAAIAAGKADKAWTKKLRRRFTALQFRNFSSYGRRSAAAFGPDEKIRKQVRKFERAVEKELDDLKKLV